VVGIRVLEKNLELADGIHRLAVWGLLPGADAKVVILRWRDECWGSG